jgi:hypothetical protein
VEHATCAVDGCETQAGYRGRTMRGWCNAHYQVWFAYGDPLARPVRPRDTGECQVCGEPSAPKRLNWCEACYCRTHRNGHSGYVDRLAEQPTYRAAHSRVERARGKAREHACLDCDAQAAHWSFDHRRVPESEWIWCHDRGQRPYTGNPADYDPRCCRCAARYDRAY